MFPGMNEKLLKQAMKKMGMKQEEIEASEVIIKCPDRQLIIKNPQVSKINAMGQETLQISGNIEEQPLEKFTKEDIAIVIKQTNCKKEEAKQALEETGDIAAAILKLKDKS